MTNEPDTIRVFIPLTFKKRNGRPKILPPDNVERLAERRQDPHVLHTIGRTGVGLAAAVGEWGGFNAGGDCKIGKGVRTVCRSKYTVGVSGARVD